VQWNNEVRQSLLLRDALRKMQLAKRAIFRVGSSGKNVEHLGSAMPNHILDLVPDHLAAKQLCEVAPHLVAVVCELQREPQREFVIFRVGVTKKQCVALFCLLVPLSQKNSSSGPTCRTAYK
jgi:hypothetical protein